MKIEVEISGKWLLLEKEQSSLWIKSLKNSVNDPGLRKIGDKLMSELNQLKVNDENAEFLKKEKFWHLSLVFESPEYTLLKSDIIRSTPLLYRFRDDSLWISDRIKFDNGHNIDRDLIYEFTEMNNVLGDRTVFQDVSGVQAAEIVLFKKGGIKKSRYFRYNINQPTYISDYSNLKKNAITLDDIFHKIFKEIVESMSGRGRIIVPLSGGHDSRIIVNYLYKLGYKHVVCYSYGMPGNIQSEISEKVAKTAGYEWHFIEYTEEKWYELHSSGIFDNYIEYASNGISNPHLQDFLAVYELNKNKVLKKGDLFIPGHGLDMLSNNLDYSLLNGNAAERALKKFSWSEDFPKEKPEALFSILNQILEESGLSKEAFLDYIVWQERQAKFIFNSFRVYEFFGYEALAPFWDHRLVEFWLSVSKTLKFSRDFFKEMERETLMVEKLKDIPYSDERNLNVGQKSIKFKRLIPDFLKRPLLRVIKREKAVNEGLHMTYNLKANSVKELVAPIDNWPENVVKIVKPHLYRYPYQINYGFLTSLYTAKSIVQKNDKYS
ncbi:MAG: asparagine synthase [Balneolaceae bacterium]|nr:MAG: asparagine synthase [Balneolaceae bacterium]